MMEQAVDVIMTSEVGDDQAGGNTNKIVQAWWRETTQHTKRHDSHLAVDTLW